MKEQHLYNVFKHITVFTIYQTHLYICGKHRFVQVLRTWTNNVYKI